MLNLPPPPPSFRGLDPSLPVRIYHRHLPHWRQDGASYFVTFRLGDALPQEKLSYLQRLRDEWERAHPPPRTEQAWEEHTRDIVRRSEAWLDEGYGECYFREQRHAEHLEEALTHFQDVRYFVSCHVVMPNHCHAVLRPFAGWELEDILKGMKGVVARRVNLAAGISGSIWQEESYDRIVRDEEHLWRIIQYIGRNPRLAGLPRTAWRRWIHPEWEELGWRFVDEAI
ncbi:MAG: transposase [Planctomycetes bacterium]|nr:transposase [Planctomycetota bacterium]